MNEIIASAHDPRALEELYRSTSDKKAFTRAVDEIHRSQTENMLMSAWHERLSSDTIAPAHDNPQLLKHIAVILALCVVAGTFFRSLIEVEGMDSNMYIFWRNIGFVFFPAVAAVVMLYRRVSTRTAIAIAGIVVLLLAYLNLLPWGDPGHTTVLAIAHAQFILWSLIGVVFVNRKYWNPDARMEFLQKNGEALIMMAILQICGVIFSGLTLALFASTTISIDEFYSKNIIPYGAVAVAVVGAYLSLYYPAVSRKIINVIAAIFAPMLLILIVTFLISMLVTGKNPVAERDVLINYNALLVAVLAVITYSIAQRKEGAKKLLRDYVIFALICSASIANIIALYAISNRLLAYGISPNRAAIIGINVLVFVNLILIGRQYAKLLFGKSSQEFSVTKIIASYLNVYLVWAIIVVLLFPMLFGFQ